MNQLQSGFNIFQFIKNSSVAALFAGAAILFFGCEKNNLEEIKAFTITERFPIIEANDFETTVTDSGQIRYNLKAPKLLKFENEGKAYYEFPEGIVMVQYDANRKLESSLSADYAIQFEDENKWEAKNNVIATNAMGDTLKTEHLIYEIDAEKIYSEEFVTIIGTDQTITGYGFVSDQKMLNWKIKNPRGPIYLTVDENDQPVNSTESTTDERYNQPANRPLEFEEK